MIEPKPTLLIMAKAPRVGQGKSRLARDIGRVEAWRINRALHAHTLKLSRDARWQTILCVAPDSALNIHLPGVWPKQVVRLGQGRGDLGARLARVLRARRFVAVAGTDCPAVSPAHIAAAFRALRQRRFALGPTPDGGFWILAARSGLTAALGMTPVRWSSAHAAADVMRNLGAGNIALLATLRDIDTGADLRA
jgi:uncharacterized protein